jgi:multidrug resistance efflux pump
MADSRIPLAGSVRWRRIRSQGVPIAVFAMAVLASGWLWRERGVGVQSVGEVSSPRVDVTSPITGLLVALPHRTSGEWSEYDRIEAGDVVARIEEKLGEAAAAIELKAPISGTLVRIDCRPGQTVIAGKLIATIAANQGRNIIGFIPEDSALAARPGMRVSLRPRTTGAPRMESEVEEVGTQIEKIPGHQQTNVSMPQWGTPVRIKLPNDSLLRPGTLVDLVFEAPLSP